MLMGGGVGFYWKETYYVRTMEERAKALEGELQVLRDKRQKMESLLGRKE